MASFWHYDDIIWTLYISWNVGYLELHTLTHWGRVTHICVDKITIIVSDNGLLPDRRQAIISTNAGLLSIGSLRTYFNENLIKIQQFSLMKLDVKMPSAKWRPSCPGLNVLIFMCYIKTTEVCQPNKSASNDKSSNIDKMLTHNLSV